MYLALVTTSLLLTTTSSLGAADKTDWSPVRTAEPARQRRDSTASSRSHALGHTLSHAHQEAAQELSYSPVLHADYVPPPAQSCLCDPLLVPVTMCPSWSSLSGGAEAVLAGLLLARASLPLPASQLDHLAATQPALLQPALARALPAPGGLPALLADRVGGRTLGSLLPSLHRYL